MTKIKQRKLAFNITVFMSLLIGCTTNQDKQGETLSLKLFSIQDSSMPISIIVQSGDGYNGKFLFNSSDTIYFNFGYDIDNLSEKDPAVIYYPHNEADIRNNLDTALVDPSKIVYTNKPNVDIDEFRKQNVYFEIISGYKAKLTLPREVRNGGITGMYVDSLRKDDGGRLKFNLYARNLDSLHNQNLIKAIRNIKFHLN
jgi:hypothetical protein